jgi:hypothetical protein
VYQNQPKPGKKQFLNYQTAPPSPANGRSGEKQYSLVSQRYVSKKLQDETTSVLCHNSDVIPSANYETSLLLSGGQKRTLYPTSR